MRLSDFDYSLPVELIARHPPPERDGARLLRIPSEGPFEHSTFRDLPKLLAPGDLLVLNDARVIKARLRGRKIDTGGEVEILLDRPLMASAGGSGDSSAGTQAPPPEDGHRWLALGNASKGFKAGQRLSLAGTEVVVSEVGDGGRLTVDFGSADALELANAHGELPLPPYLDRAAETADAERYQTVFARQPGAVAAPTAGLHFDARTFEALKARGVQVAFLTLQVGPGTFLPVRSEEVSEHHMLEERFAISPALAVAFDATRKSGGGVIAVGTTVTRALERAVTDDGKLNSQN